MSGSDGEAATLALLARPTYPLGMAETLTPTITFDSDDFARACAYLREQLAALGRALLAVAHAIARCVAALVRAYEVTKETLRRYTVPLIAASEGWTGLARRHALRPPTRGYWTKRCVCQACGLRAFMKSGS